MGKLSYIQFQISKSLNPYRSGGTKIVGKLTWGEAFFREGRAILSPNPTANSASVAEEEGEACETSLFKSPQGY